MAILFTVTVWGIGPVFIRTLSVELGPADHLVIRYTLVTLAYLAGLALIGGWRIEREDWPRLLLIALIGLVGYNLGAAFGFELVTAGVGSLINGTQPLLIAFLGAMAAREKLYPATLAGLAVAFAGVVMLIWNDLGLTRNSSGFLLGCIYIFLGLVAFSVYVIVSKPLVRKYGAYSISAMSTALATAAMLLLLARPSVVGTVASMNAGNWLDMSYVVVLSTFLGTLTWNYGASRLPAATSGALLYLMPVFGVWAGALLLNETVTSLTLIGGALILLGVAIVQFGPHMRGTQLERPEG